MTGRSAGSASSDVDPEEAAEKAAWLNGTMPDGRNAVTEARPRAGRSGWRRLGGRGGPGGGRRGGGGGGGGGGGYYDRR
jgi:hypothetical protein